MIYAVIDIGSNTVRMCIYDYTGGELQRLINKKKSPGLISYVDENNDLSEQGIEKASEVLNGFKRILDSFHIDHYYVFATASLRNINNRKAAVDAIGENTGFEIDVISGEQEAKTGFYGATYATNLRSGLLVDIGGGSTELLSFEDGQIVDAVSLPIGCLNTYNNYISGLFPTPKENIRIEQQMFEYLDGLEEFKGQKFCDICGIGGSIRGAFKLHKAFFHSRVLSTKMPVAEIDRLLAGLYYDEKERQKAVLKSIPDRIHTIIPGIVILNSIAKYYESETVATSVNGVREGYILRKLDHDAEKGEK